MPELAIACCGSWSCTWPGIYGRHRQSYTALCTGYAACVVYRGARGLRHRVTAGPARGEGGGTLAHSCARYGAPKDVRVYSPTFGRSRHLLRHLSRSSKVYVPLRCAMNRRMLSVRYVVRFPNPANDARRRSDVRAGRGPPRGPGPAPDPRARPPAAPPRYGFAVTRPELPTGRAGPSRARPAALAECESSVTRDPRKGPPTAHTYRVGPTAASGLVPPAACRTLLDASRHQSSPAPPRDD